MILAHQQVLLGRIKVLLDRRSSLKSDIEDAQTMVQAGQYPSSPAHFKAHSNAGLVPAAVNLVGQTATPAPTLGTHRVLLVKESPQPDRRSSSPSVPAAKEESDDEEEIV